MSEEKIQATNFHEFSTNARRQLIITVLPDLSATWTDASDLAGLGAGLFHRLTRIASGFFCTCANGGLELGSRWTSAGEYGFDQRRAKRRNLA